MKKIVTRAKNLFHLTSPAEAKPLIEAVERMRMKIIHCDSDYHI